jgi:hypothetical protein
MRLTSVLANLELRKPDNSLAWAGYWILGVGGLMVLGELANIAGRLPRRSLPPKVPRWAQVIWGAVGLCAGSAFILWALLSGPGIAYGAIGAVIASLIPHGIRLSTTWTWAPDSRNRHCLNELSGPAWGPVDPTWRL